QHDANLSLARSVQRRGDAARGHQNPARACRRGCNLRRISNERRRGRQGFYGQIMLERETPAIRSSEETRNRIFAATRQLLAKKGRRGTTTREISELAGVNEATLFRHFGNKDA